MTDRRKTSIVAFLIACIIFLLLLIICGIGVFFLFFRTPAEESPQITEVHGQTGALASQKLSNGLLLELIAADRQKDGLVESRWRYHNPSSTKIRLCSNDEGKRLREGVCCECAGKKYYPYKFSDNELISNIGWVDVEPGKTRTFWAKFDLPANEKTPTLSLFIPGLLLPFEDIKVREIGNAAENGEKYAAEHSSGLIIEVSRVKKSSGGLLELRWKYSNPTNEAILLFSTDDAESLPSRIYLESDGSRIVYAVHKDSQGVPSASMLPYTTVQPMGKIEVFAKFQVEVKDNDTFTLYLPDSTPITGLKEGFEK